MTDTLSKPEYRRWLELSIGPLVAVAGALSWYSTRADGRLVGRWQIDVLQGSELIVTGEVLDCDSNGWATQRMSNVTTIDKFRWHVANDQFFLERYPSGVPALKTWAARVWRQLTTHAPVTPDALQFEILAVAPHQITMRYVMDRPADRRIVWRRLPE